MKHRDTGNAFLLLELVISLSLIALCSSLCAVTLARFFEQQRERVACVQALACATSLIEQDLVGLDLGVNFQNTHFLVKKSKKSVHTSGLHAQLIHILRLRDHVEIATFMGAVHGGL